MIFPFAHLGHALHTLKDLLDGGDENATTKTPEAVRAEQRSELEGRIAGMNLPPEIRGQIVALIQTGDLHAARQAIRAAATRPAPAPPLPEVPRPAPTRSVNPGRDRGQGQDRQQGGGFGF